MSCFLNVVSSNEHVIAQPVRNNQLQWIADSNIARPRVYKETCQVPSDACANGSSPAVTVQLPTVDDANDFTEVRPTKKGRRKNIERKERCQLDILRPQLSTLREIPQRTSTVSSVPIVGTSRVRGRRRERHCRHLDMHGMSAIAGASVALAGG